MTPKSSGREKEHRFGLIARWPKPRCSVLRLPANLEKELLGASADQMAVTELHIWAPRFMTDVTEHPVASPRKPARSKRWASGRPALAAAVKSTPFCETSEIDRAQLFAQYHTCASLPLRMFATNCDGRRRSDGQHHVKELAGKRVDL